MQLLQKIVVTILLGFLLVSCNQEPSLQKYYVENQENQENPKIRNLDLEEKRNKKYRISSWMDP